tara:strand:- start:36 stop:710 length:675 start_codon:yes stop_codon:yes gene_type:complete
MAINKLPIKKLVEFRRLSKGRKQTFANKLKVTKEVSSGGGGDYWVRSISTISNAFKVNDNTIVKAKLEEVSTLYNSEQRSQTKSMYKRNIDILKKYQDFDFTEWRPSADLNFLAKPQSILEMHGLPIQIRPQQIFSYGSEGNQSIGGIWFITWLQGYNDEDLGIYSEALFRYLSSYFSQDYIINPAACMVVDVVKMKVIGYNKIIDREIPSLLDSSIENIKSHL